MWGSNYDDYNDDDNDDDDDDDDDDDGTMTLALVLCSRFHILRPWPLAISAENAESFTVACGTYGRPHYPFCCA